MLHCARLNKTCVAYAGEASCGLTCPLGLQCVKPVPVHAEGPQDINGFMERLGFGGAGGGFGGPAALGAGLPPVADPEAAYATQLEQLQVCLRFAPLQFAFCAGIVLV